MTRLFHNVRSRGPIRYVTRNIVWCAAIATLAACADAPTGLNSAVRQAPGVSAVVMSMDVVGDTTTTVMVVAGNGQDVNGYFGKHSLTFPYGVASICDPNTSSYGPGTWDDPCTPASAPITITAKSWVDKVTGATKTEFQPAMRFVPGLPQKVTLTLDDASPQSDHIIDYCTPAGCVDESAADPSLLTTFDAASQKSSRIIKHFSGYNIVVN